MSLKMHQSGGHFYRRVGVYCVQLSSLGLLGLMPVYQATAVHSPAFPEHSGSASPVSKSPTTVSKQPMKKESNESQASKDATQPVQTRDCRTSSRRVISEHASSQLRALGAYEALCGGAVFSSLSFFVSTPTNAAEADELSGYVSAKLIEFRTANVKPVVFMEPTSVSGLIDMKLLATGAYDEAIDRFFAGLATRGISSSDMGIWVPVPEGNIPVWTSLDPAVYRSAVVRVAQAQKRHFPNSQTSILLDTFTYPKNGEWSNGAATSILPYIKGMPPGLIDSVGLQGFPWVSPKDQGAIANGEVSDYLRPELAIEAARALGVSEIWMNTGTFAQKYTTSSQKVTMPAVERRKQLDAVLDHAERVQTSGFRVAVHLFAENKLHVAEQTNWSYLPAETSDEHSAVLTNFVAGAQARGINLWLYDS